MGAHLLALNQWAEFGPTSHCAGGCLHCRDCRRGLLVDITDFIPVIDAEYTRSYEAAEDTFIVRTLSFGRASGPYYLGMEMKEGGGLLRQCCERIIGTCMLDFTSETDGALDWVEGAIVLGMKGVGTGDEVYLKIQHSDPTHDTYLFRFIRPFAAVSGPVESPLCHIPKGVFTGLGNTLAADYEDEKAYITEFEELLLPVKPAYCNSDGGYALQGMTPAADVENAVYNCACSDCYGTNGYTLTVSNLSSLCVLFMQPEVDEIDLTWDLEEIGGDPTNMICSYIPPSESDQLTNEHAGTPVECDAGSNPTDLCFTMGDPASSWTAQASIHFNIDGYPGEDERNVKVTITLTFVCGDPADGIAWTGTCEAYFAWECAGGIQPRTATGVAIDFYLVGGGAGPAFGGTLDIAIAPA